MKAHKNYKGNRKVIPYPYARAAAYPNAATTRQLIDKTIDFVITAATSAGIVTVLLCLFTFYS